MPYKKPVTEEQRKKQREAAQRWREANRDTIRKKSREWQKKYREKNREKINTYFREYYKKNREKQIARATSWNKRNPDKIKAYRNTDSRKEYLRKWKEANPEKVLIYQDKCLERKRKLKAVQEHHEKRRPSSP